MITGLVLSNLLYPVVAVAVAIVAALIVVARHRRPRSIEANMKTFHRGLRALAPENGGQGRHEPAPIRVSVQPRPARSLAGDGERSAGLPRPSTDAPSATAPEAEAG